MNMWQTGPFSRTQHTRSPSDPNEVSFCCAYFERRMPTPAALSSGNLGFPLLGPLHISFGDETINDLSRCWYFCCLCHNSVIASTSKPSCLQYWKRSNVRLRVFHVAIVNSLSFHPSPGYPRVESKVVFFLFRRIPGPRPPNAGFETKIICSISNIFVRYVASRNKLEHIWWTTSVVPTIHSRNSRAENPSCVSSSQNIPVETETVCSLSLCHLKWLKLA